MLVKNNSTYSICNDCPSEGNCCSRAKPNGRVDSPFLSSGDIDRIGLDLNQYSEIRTYGDESVRVIKTSDNGCYFYKDGKCSIYSERPIDCRLFPLDIIENSQGGLTWIAYTNLCHREFDPREYLKGAKLLLPEFGEDIYMYAKIKLPGMDKEPYVELEEVELPTVIEY
jgi:Fe-S-cluster containining protein